MSEQKFQIGQIVYNKVSKRGSYEPSTCKPYTSLEISKAEKCGDTFKYTCGYDGYCFMENELISVDEYLDMIKEGKFNGN